MHCAHERAAQDDANTKIISDALDAHANWAFEALQVKQERLDKECSTLHKDLATANALLKESRGFTTNAHTRAQLTMLQQKYDSLERVERDKEQHLQRLLHERADLQDKLKQALNEVAEKDVKYAELEALANRRCAELKADDAEKSNRLLKAVSARRHDFERLADRRQNVINDLRDERAKMIIELGQLRPQLNAVDMMTRNVAKIPGESVSDAMCRYLKSLHAKLRELKQALNEVAATKIWNGDGPDCVSKLVTEKEELRQQLVRIEMLLLHGVVGIADPSPVYDRVCNALRKLFQQLLTTKGERDSLKDQLESLTHELEGSKKWDKTGADYISKLSAQCEKHKRDVESLVHYRNEQAEIIASQKVQLADLHEWLAKVAEFRNWGKFQP